MNENVVTISTVSEEQSTLDVLDRGAFVEQLIDIANLLSDGRKNSCYAINGEWGVGKSFVLDMFEKEAERQQSDTTDNDRYMVFRYNCWAYDYYEEPIIAIVAALIDAIDAKERMIPAETRGKVKGILKALGASILNGLSDKATEFVKGKSGIDIAQIEQIVRDGFASADKEWEASHEFDPYFEFKKTLKGLRKVIGELTKEKTLLVIVDELDRCLPEYTIRVLERLHHVFDDVPNVQVILAVDKSQLEKVITNIYGNETQVERYLAKFVDFEITLTCGEVNGALKARFPHYFSCFEYQAVTEHDVEAFTTTILKGVDVRGIGAIIEKSVLCHKLLWPEESCCSSILCIEVFLALLKHYGLKVSAAKTDFDISRLFIKSGMFSHYSGTLTGLAVLSEKYMKGAKQGLRYYASEDGYSYVNCIDIYGLILGCYRIILGYTNDYWQYGKYEKERIQDYVLKYWRLLKSVH